MVIRPPDAATLRRLGRDLAYILPGLPLALLGVAVLWPLTVVSTVLGVVWVGVLLIPLALALASAFAQLSRSRLRRWGLEVAPPRYRPRGRGARGLLRLLTDPRRWLDLAFEALVALPLRLVTFVIAVAWPLAGAAGLTYWLWNRFLPDGALIENLPGAWALMLLGGLVLALTTPTLVSVSARADASVSAALLGGALAPMPHGPGEIVSLPVGSEETGGSLSSSAWTRMAVAFAAFVLVVVGWPVTAVLYDVDPAVAMVVTVAHSAAAILAVRWPWAGLSLSVAAALATMLVTTGGQGSWPWPWPVTSLLAHCLTLVVLALCHRWFWAVSAWSAGAVLTLGSLLVTSPELLPGGTLRSVLTNGVVLVAVSGGVLLLSLMVHQWILIAGQVERAETHSAEEERRRRELEERNRIARELHDVVAHSMSVITVQAGTAKYRMPAMTEQTEQEFEDIAASARQALGEMRSLLTILRTEDGASRADGDIGVDTVPLPDLGDVTELVASSRASGTRITVTGVAETLARCEVPPTVGLTAYRVVQEALSNALRHARGSAITVRVGTEEDGSQLVVEVVNSAPEGIGESLPGSGLGLAGTRERVTSLGGSVGVGPTSSGGFAVRARLPLVE